LEVQPLALVRVQVLVQAVWVPTLQTQKTEEQEEGHQPNSISRYVARELSLQNQAYLLAHDRRVLATPQSSEYSKTETGPTHSSFASLSIRAVVSMGALSLTVTL